jgi:hypothetical protein
MTSEEIKQKQAVDLSTNGWLREVCIQLALLNEKTASSCPDFPPPFTGVRGPSIDELFAQRDNARSVEPERVKRAYTKRT